MAEKTVTGRISGIKRNAVHDGDGLRTTVFFKGCPLRCLWCHNPESIPFGPEVGFYTDKCLSCRNCVAVCPQGAVHMRDGRPVTDPGKCSGCFRCTENCPADARIAYGEVWEADRLVRKLLQDKPFYDNSHGGVTLSGGECLSQPDFAEEIARRLYAEWVSVDIDTCGFCAREVLERIIPYTDTFLYDMKAIDPEVHKKCTGQDNSLILDNLRFLIESGSRVEIRYPYVPGYNDGECEKIGDFLCAQHFKGKIKVLGYHNLADGKYTALIRENTLPDVIVSADDVEKAVLCLKNKGLRAVNGMLED